MALTGSKVYSGPLVTKGTSVSTSQGVICSFAKSSHSILNLHCQRVGLRQLSNIQLFKSKYIFCNEEFWCICENRACITGFSGFSVSCTSTGTSNTETKECVRKYGDCTDIPSATSEKEDEDPDISVRIIDSRQGLAEAYKFVHNDAKFMNERARNDIFLLSRSIMRLDARARQDVAILSSEFLKLDARAREDTEKIDRNMKRKAERLHHIASILKDKAQSRLKRAADKHWSNGALEADLRRADFRAKQRAVEDTLMALEFVKNVHDIMVSRLYNCPLGRKIVSKSARNVMGNLTIEKNGRTLDLFPGDVSVDRISAIQEAYLSMASALSEADGIDYTDPEELELLITTLIDLDAMDGKSSASLLAECSSSPDVNTRQALANALAKAPSMWTLGNAGMGALQRLAEDSNPAVAAAASKAIYELKKEWEIEEGDSWRLMMDQSPEAADGGADTDADKM